MGYTILLKDNKGASVTVPDFKAGSTYIIDPTPYGTFGSSKAELEVTYNYSPLFKKVFGEEGLKWLYDKKAEDTIEALSIGKALLGVNCDIDYYKPTEGNGGCVLSLLLEWAKLHPDAKWEVL